MPCNRPLSGFKSRATGGFTQNRSQGDVVMVVPCGRCQGCRIDKARWWTVRVAHEAQLHDDSCFITVTYSDDHLPDPPSVSKRDFQLFMKRLRKALKADRVRFFACGEYGGSGGRPHYHAIIFGHAFRQDRYFWATTPKGTIEYRSPLLETAWGLGHCTLSDITPQSGGYVARYTMKKTATNRERINGQTGEVYYVDEEFLAMSRRPGIGSGWFDKFRSELFPNDFCIINGTRMPLPPYYWAKLTREADQVQETYELTEEVKDRRKERLQIMRDKGELRPHRLETKEELLRLRAESSTRDMGQ